MANGCKNNTQCDIVGFVFMNTNQRTLNFLTISQTDVILATKKIGSHETILWLFVFFFSGLRQCIRHTLSSKSTYSAFNLQYTIFCFHQYVCQSGIEPMTFALQKIPYDLWKILQNSLKKCFRIDQTLFNRLALPIFYPTMVNKRTIYRIACDPICHILYCNRIMSSGASKYTGKDDFLT